jgi:hypothetical protein
VRYKQPSIKSFDVVGFIPSADLAAIAACRTAGLVASYVHLGARAKHTQILASSCYMQGINDMMDALNQRGLIVVPKENK